MTSGGAGNGAALLFSNSVVGMKLVALRSFVYASRHLIPGDDFDTKSERDAKVLVGARKARLERAPVDLPPPPPAVAEQIKQAFPPAAAPAPAETSAPGATDATDDLKSLRAEYESVIGKKPFGGWNAEQLRAKITEAKAAD